MPPLRHRLPFARKSRMARCRRVSRGAVFRAGIVLAEDEHQPSWPVEGTGSGYSSRWKRTKLASGAKMPSSCVLKIQEAQVMDAAGRNNAGKNPPPGAWTPRRVPGSCRRRECACPWSSRPCPARAARLRPGRRICSGTAKPCGRIRAPLYVFSANRRPGGPGSGRRGGAVRGFHRQP